MADANKKDDLQFNTAELVDDDPKVADRALEKRNSPAPESIRDKLDKTSWPEPEGRKPAVMRADTEESLEYKLDTYKEVNDDSRAHERTFGVGSVGVAETAKRLRKADNPNEVQAPPSAPAKLAAEGEGAENTPIPVTRRDNGKAKK